MSVNDGNSAKRVFAVVKKIPRGKVLTYGIVSKYADVLSPRFVGTLLHNNPDPVRIPCHRVVNAKGYVAKHYAFGGAQAQARRLLSEGVSLKNGRVDVAKYLWRA